MRRLLIIFFLLPFVSHGQDNRYDKLLEIVKQKGGLVVSCNPMTMELDSWRLKRFNRQRADSVLSDSLISQIVQATKNWDTTYWVSREFKGTIVVQSRKVTLSTKQLLNDWNISDKGERKKYRQQINKWINTDADNRPINFLSRPVLTKDKNFGLIAWDLVSNGLCCGGQVILYKYDSGEWKDLGPIYTWAH